MPGDVAALTAEVEGRLTELGFELVDIRVGGSTARVRLQIRIDWREAVAGHGITVDDCAKASRALEAWLDESKQAGEQYVLEVSSPGIERPVRRREHWERFTGREVSVRLKGRGRVRATIARVPPEGNDVVLKLADGGEELTVAITDARDATLVVDWNAERL